ncbi:hypothetical protein BOX15_Mlig005042g2 [Macrostomum lignano]|uniref:beta-N-acetylhexosaminidase n=1 Tax=Macrostomum lignano TaxID=282301 RepID=A0A267DHF5_9PLAT|nr:hypothetical protein BOX15_Mlig005042g2 [Macrostomum lignano]
MSMLAWFPVSRHQLTPLLLLLVPIDLILCQNRDPDFGNSNSRLIQHEPGAILHKEVRQKLATPAVPTQRPIPDDVGLAGENNFALLDPPDTEFHVWRAPFPSVGEAWPRPTRQYASRSRGRITAPEHLSLAAKEFQFVLTSPTESDCPIAVVELLKMAFQRYRRVIVDQRAVSVAAGAAADADGHIRQLSVRLTIQSSDEKWRTAPLMPSLDMDESYTLKISKTEAVLSAPEPWGVLRGLQTFSQLVWQTQDAALYINSTTIFDKPRFKHRGLLVDTSRHYLSMETLKTNLDAMEMNKLNVFHWHIVDDQSFPYQSVVFPKLSEKGAYDSNSIYSLSNIREIIEYARVRGIRVIPEFDTPAHTHSWSLGYPEIFTQCFNYANRWTGFYGPMNPALNATFDFLKKLYAEISSVFKDNYIHLGADEVGTSCWDNNPIVNRMRADFGFSRSDQLIDYYFRRLQNIITSLSAGKSNSNKRGFIVWQEAYDHGVMLKRGTIVQVWKGEASDVAMVAQAGYRVLYSTCWYLDRLEYGPQWTKMYLCDPIANYAGTYNGGPFQQQMPQQQPPPQQQQQQQPPPPSWMANVLGGEACMWNEYQDDNTVLQRIWPLASAVAERLWSSPEATRDLLAAGRRIEEQRCRMRARGIPVGVASGPGSCRPPPPAGNRSRNKLPKRNRKIPKLEKQSLTNRMVGVKQTAAPLSATGSGSSKIDSDYADSDHDLSFRRALVKRRGPQQQHRDKVPIAEYQHRNRIYAISKSQHHQHPVALFLALVLAALALFLVLSRAVFVLRITRYGGSTAGLESAGSTEGKAAWLLWPWLRPRRLLLCLAIAAACNVLVWLWTSMV